MFQFRSPSGQGVIELVETNKEDYVYIWRIVKIERTTGYS